MTSIRAQFIEKISKKKSTILTIQDLKRIGEDILKEDNVDKKVYKLIYHAKNKGHLFAIKKDLFIPISPEKIFDEQQIIDKHYRPLLKKHNNKITGKQRYISGLKALELINNNYNPADNIDIIGPKNHGSTTLFFDKKVHIKTYTNQLKSLFPLLYKNTENIKIGTTTLQRSNLELALLETLYSPDMSTLGYAQELIKRTLKKYKKVINIDTIILLVRGGKHHSSLNRLHQISLAVDQKFALKLEETIKKYSFTVDV